MPHESRLYVDQPPALVTNANQLGELALVHHITGRVSYQSYPNTGWDGTLTCHAWEEQAHKTLQHHHSDPTPSHAFPVARIFAVMGPIDENKTSNKTYRLLYTKYVELSVGTSNIRS